MIDIPRTARPSVRRRAFPADQRGSVTVMIAVSMTALIALLALGIDLGALFSARSEAQRAADAAALAGASAFLEYQEAQAYSEAVKRATEFATSNEILNTEITREEVSIWVDMDSSTVRAAVRRNGVPTWFARLLGTDAVDIGAEATAWAGTSGAAQCVKPFALPDLWEETTDDTNGNRLWDEGEHWRYDPMSGDRYERYSGAGSSPNETGYGSDWRDGQIDGTGGRSTRDYGRRVVVKATSPSDAFVPSFFLPWALPSDGGQGECGSSRGGGGGIGGGGGSGGIGGGGSDTGDGEGGSSGGSPFGWLKWTEKRGDLGVTPGGPDGDGPPGRGGDGPPGHGGDGPPGSGSGGPSPEPGGTVRQDDGSGKGAARYRRNICSCNNSVIDLDTEYLIEPGNMVGPTYQGVQELVAQDPGAFWDDRSKTVVSQYGMDSPRVVTVALFDPGEISKPGRQRLRFNNFARIFIEEQASRKDPVTGRFLYYVRGIGRGRQGETTGSLVRTLQLIR